MKSKKKFSKIKSKKRRPIAPARSKSPQKASFPNKTPRFYHKKRKKSIKVSKQATPLTAPEKRTLQKYWYSKLKDSGFRDLEKFDHNMDAYDLLQGHVAASIARVYDPKREVYYRKLTNFVTHNEGWYNKVAYAVAQLYVDGLPYRKISALLRARKMKLSIWSVHKIVKRLEVEAFEWNKRHPEGIDFQSDIG